MIKKLLKTLTSRVTIVGVLILLQAAVVVYLVLFITKYSLAVFGVLQLFAVATVVWLVSKNENPSYKLAWVILILTVPILGVVFYVLFGNKRSSKNHDHKVVELYKNLLPHWEQYISSVNLTNELLMKDRKLGRQAEYVQKVSSIPPFKNTSCEYCCLGEQFNKRLLEELAKAKNFIFMEFFIIERGKMWDPIFELLQRKVKEGVDVRVMYDDIGAINTLPTGYEKIMRSVGIKAVVFNPFKPHLNSMLNFRDHRKICVIDGNIGFTGGINIADEYINAFDKHGHWKDTAVILKGEAVIGLTGLFLHLWTFSGGDSIDNVLSYIPTERYKTDGYVQPFGDSPLDDENVAESIYMQIISSATDYVYITTPYLILDNEMLTALTIAAKSGVDVRIMTPGRPDKWFVHPVTRSFYSPLIEAGVKIYEYTPGFVHAKMYVADDKVAIVGTANMDYRSFYLHFECGAIFYYSSMVSAVKQDILTTLLQCELISKEKANGNFAIRLGRALLRIFAPLM